MISPTSLVSVNSSEVRPQVLTSTSVFPSGISFSLNRFVLTLGSIFVRILPLFLFHY